MLIIRDIAILFARISGRVASLFYGLKLKYLFYIFIRNFITALYSRSFKAFGKRSLLGSGVTLLSPQHISIGRFTSIMKGCVLESCAENMIPELIIGNNVSLGEYSHVTCAQRIIIGDNVLTGRYVLITDNAHGSSDRKTLDTPPLARCVVSKGEVIIDDNVWLGDRVTILPGVHVGKGCIIGAGSVVTRDVPPYTIVGGNPAKILKQL